MNCRNAYIAYVVLLAMLYNTYADITLISEIHSSELIILGFSDFLLGKKNLQSQQKNFIP